MSIYRGPGGSGDAVNDASSEATLVAQLVVEAQVDADAAQASATAAAGSASTASTQATNASNSAAAAAASAVTAANYVVPSQTGNNGKYLKTDGTATSWDALDISTADITGTLPLANGGTGGTTAATARTSLGLAIGTDVQAWDADLDTWATKTAPTGTVVGTSDTQTLTNKTIALGSNTISGTLAQFNTAVTDADLVSIAGTETLTNKTLTSPTLTTPALGTPASGVVTNLTGTASININGTVGATTANTGAFTTLGATGVATFSAGTVALPSITTTGDTNTGIYFPAADTIAFTEGGAESMRIDSSGNVGIGAAPVAGYGKLQVRNSFIYVNEDGADTRSVYIRSSLNGVPAIQVATNDPLAFTTSNVERMRIDASGNVGIGTSSPFGTATSRVVLSVNGTTDSMMNLGVNGTRTANFYTSATQTIVGSHTSIPLVFETANTERMRIDSSGNLLVGTTTQDSGAKFTLDSGGSVALSTIVNTTASAGRIYFKNPNGLVGQISTSGSLTTYSVSSDYRLKENLSPLIGSKEFILSLKPKQGNWKADGSKFVGFVAHEFAETSPTSVVGEKDAVDENGKPVYQAMQASSAEVMANLVALVQEQQTLINNLTTRLNALEGK